MRKTSPTRYVIQNLRKSTTMIKTKDTDVKDVTTTSEARTALSDYGGKTTLHGLRYALQLGISPTRRLIWVTVLLACVGMLLLQIVDRVMYYYSLPMDVNFRVNYNTSLLFPAVTICNQNSFKTTLANQSNLYHLLEKMHAPSDTVTVDDLQYYGAANITLDTIFLLTAHKKEDFITKCSWKGTKCGPDDFDLIATDHGICYTFNNRDVGKSISSVGN
ncbi:Acid-sensing ion channel 2 [Mizuhopecten yessoensis]|uniref:Acid-sensing ion channel 2 n=1 Tax=Mizuhopecten yessoensis TaxID=6573 RepID=A0A210PT70_MIZYE|nr:Acid-sensing ion channel 2 [Mizuhopecten yessoensis]